MKHFIIFSLSILFSSNLLAQPEIRIGAVLPLSGDAQAFGQEARMALEHALADNPSTKFKFKLLFEDDQLSPAKASLSAKKLVDLDDVKVVFSNWSYGGNAVASALESKDALNLAFAWDPKILEVGKNNFITSGMPENLAEKIILKIKSEGKKSIMLFGFQEAGVEFAFNSIEAYAKQNGIKVLKRVEVNPADPADFRSLLMQVRSLHPEYLVTCLLYHQMLEFLKQMKVLKIDLPVGTIGQVPYNPTLGSMLPKIWWSVDYLASSDDQAKILKRTGLDNLSGYPSYYESLRVIITIFEDSPSGDIPTTEYLHQRLSKYKSDKSLLGRISYANRRFQSENVTVLNQILRY